MKHLKTVFLALCLVLAAAIVLPMRADAATIASGTCGAEGDNLTWTLDDAGTLTISGIGAMPDSLPIAPWYSDCSKIKTAIIGDSVVNIGEYAFDSCAFLSSVIIGDSVTSIGDRSFLYCSSLTSVTIPDSVTNIGKYAFSYCSSLESVTIGDSVSTIEYGAFSHCSSLESVTIGDSVSTIEYYAFSYCDSLTDVYYHGTDEDWDNIAIGYMNDSLINATVHCAIASGTCGAEGDNLTWLLDDSGTLTISGTGAMADYDYGGAPWYSVRSKIRTVLIGSGVTSIGCNAVVSCYSLLSVTIGDSVTSIGNYAFYNCYVLPSVTIGNGVTSVGKEAFRLCDSLNDVYYNGTEAGWNRIAIGLDNSPLLNATRHYANTYTVTYNANGGEGAPTAQTKVEGIALTLSSIVPTREEYTFLGWATSADGEVAYAPGTNYETDADATLYAIWEKQEAYHLNSITLKDTCGNELSAIPDGKFFATVSFTNVTSDKDAVIILAQYTATGAFKGLMYVQTEDVPVGATIKLSIPVDNTNGDVAQLRAFCWESFLSPIPLGNSVSFLAGN